MATLSERRLGYGTYENTYKATPDPNAAALSGGGLPVAGATAATDIWEEILYYPGTSGSPKGYRLVAASGTVINPWTFEHDA